MLRAQKTTAFVSGSLIYRPRNIELRSSKVPEAMPDEPDNSIEISLLIEHSHGVCEVTIRARPEGHSPGTTVMILKPLSGAKHSVPSHSAIANALQMQRWMFEHPMVFLEGLTAH